MRNFPTLNITVPADVKKDMKERNNFMPSKYLVEKYRGEFMTTKAIKEEIKRLTERLIMLHSQLTGERESNPAKIQNAENRCALCSMFFHDKISFRKKISYKNINFCYGCYSNRRDECDILSEENCNVEESD